MRCSVVGAVPLVPGAATWSMTTNRPAWLERGEDGAVHCSGLLHAERAIDVVVIVRRPDEVEFLGRCDGRDRHDQRGDVAAARFGRDCLRHGRGLRHHVGEFGGHNGIDMPRRARGQAEQPGEVAAARHDVRDLLARRDMSERQESGRVAERIARNVGWWPGG